LNTISVALKPFYTAKLILQVRKRRQWNKYHIHFNTFWFSSFLKLYYLRKYLMIIYKDYQCLEIYFILLIYVDYKIVLESIF